MRASSPCLTRRPGRSATFLGADVIGSVRSSIRCVNLRGLGVVLAWLSTAVVGGCFSPDFSGAECMKCPDNLCPGDLVCHNHYCVRPNSTNTCGYQPPSDGGEGGSGAEAATGGTGNVGQGGSAAGGTMGQAGSGAETGEAGSTSPPGPPTIDVELVSLCTTDVSVSLRGGHGKAPYEFELVGDDSGFALVADGDGTTLQGTAVDARNYSVTVRITDAAHRTTETDVRFHVNETPSVRATELPSVCPDEKYDAVLAADGGDGMDYVFSAELDPATQLSVDGDHLSGHFVSMSREREVIPVTVRVESAGCLSAPLELSFTQEAADASACPRISINGATKLPAPCAGSSYVQSFTAQGGTQGYTWAAADLPEGLSFDADAQRLTGIPEASGTVLVEVTDAGHRTIQTAFELPGPRDRCWLAYVAPNGGHARLNLYDLLLGNRESFPAQSSAEPVLDFKFSPDGRFVAYRTGADSSAAQLHLLELQGFREQLIDVEDVGHYSWSAHASSMAVESGGAAKQFMGGVDIAGDGEVSLIPPLELPMPLAADPVWFADTGLGFMGTPAVGYFQPMWTNRSSSSFGDLRLASTFYSEGVFLRGAPDGVWFIPDKDQLTTYINVHDEVPVLHDRVLVASNGGFAARANAGELNIFRSSSPSFSTEPDVVPDGTHEGCDALLGWDQEGKQVVCARTRAGDDSERADLVVFEIDALTGAVARQTLVRGTYDFPAPTLGGRTGLARLFSERGGRLAFATDDRLYSSATAPGSATVDLTAPWPSAPVADVALAFSPDERFLIAHRGTMLLLFDLEKPTGDLRNIASPREAPGPPACSEDLRAPAIVDAPGTPYCGAFNEHLSFVWSPDSKLVAFATASGGLFVADVASDSLFTTLPATEECGTPCLAGYQFAFQPNNLEPQL